MSHPHSNFNLSQSRLPQSQEEVLERLLADFDESCPAQLQLSCALPHRSSARGRPAIDAHAGSECRGTPEQFRAPGTPARLRRLRIACANAFAISFAAASAAPRTGCAGCSELDRKGGSAAIFGSMAEACLENTEKMFAQQSVRELERAVESDDRRAPGLRARPRPRLPAGLQLLVCRAYGLRSFHPDRHATAACPSDDIIRMDERDCLLAMTFQPYRRDTLAAVQRRRRNRREDYRHYRFSSAASAVPRGRSRPGRADAYAAVLSFQFGRHRAARKPVRPAHRARWRSRKRSRRSLSPGPLGGKYL